jgi:hypothetical protein
MAPSTDTEHTTGNPADNRPQIVKPSDTNQSLRDNETALEDEFTKQYERTKITIMDRTLSDVLDRTLNFVIYSFGDYQVQVEKAELLIGERRGKDKSKDSKESFMERVEVHATALSLFLADGDNSIYIGIILIALSIIIYFINITTS